MKNFLSITELADLAITNYGTGTLITQDEVFFYNKFNVSDVETILNAPETQDEGVWKYEHLRQFCMELNGLAVKLQVGSSLGSDSFVTLRQPHYP
jgi:hypothetical protein